MKTARHFLLALTAAALIIAGFSATAQPLVPYRLTDIASGSQQGTLGPQQETCAPYPAVQASGLVYYQAKSEDHARELWRTDGTEAGTFRLAVLDEGASQKTNNGEYKALYSRWGAALGSSLVFSAPLNPAGAGAGALYVSDGVTVQLLKTFPQMPSTAAPDVWTSLNGKVFFKVPRTTGGDELWTTDGTVAGTVFVRGFADLHVAQNVHNVTDRLFTTHNNLLWFVAETVAHGTELWVSDGSTAGTRRVSDAFVQEDRPTALTGAGDYVYFLRASITGDVLPNPNGTISLWRSDGTEDGTAAICTFNRLGIPYAGNETTGEMVAYGDDLYLSADVNGSGLELCRVANGSTTPEVLTDFSTPAENATGTFGVMVFGASDYLYFFRDYFENDAQEGSVDLLRTDGTPAGTVTLLEDVYLYGPYHTGGNPFAQNYHPFIDSGEGLYFFGRTPEKHYSNRSLWFTDGTAAGTIEVAPLVYRSRQTPTLMGMTPAGFVFNTWDTEAGYEVRVLSGPADEVEVIADFFTGLGRDSGVQSFTVENDQLHFYPAVEHGAQWVSDGTLDGTRRVTPEEEEGLKPRTFALYGSHYFVEDSKLWKTNTGEVEDAESIFTFEAPLPNHYFQKVNEQYAYIISYDLVHDHLLNGATGEVTHLPGRGAEIILTTPDTAYGRYVNTAGVLIFVAIDRTTLAQTILQEGVSDAIASGDTVYLQQPSYWDIHSSIWRTDGTVEGSVQLDSAYLRGDNPWSATDSGLFYLNSTDGIDIRFLSNTLNLPVSLKPEVTSGVPQFLGALNGRMYWTEFEELNPYYPKPVKLWSSDGTVAGTKEVAFLGDFNAYQSKVNSAKFMGKLYFTLGAVDENYVDDRRLWVTDGTEAGTRTVFTSYQRVMHQEVFVTTTIEDEIAATSTTLFFSGTDRQHGQELWALGLDRDGDGVADAIESGKDTDGDGVNNHADRDNDDDGVCDLVELEAGTDPNDADEVPAGAASCVDIVQHAADIDGSESIKLQELLRVIQFFNIGGYHCDGSVSSPDGYAAGLEGDHTCTPHTTDFQQVNWRISLPEMLRLIQLFHFPGGFYPCETAPDGFCIYGN